MVVSLIASSPTDGGPRVPYGAVPVPRAVRFPGAAWYPREVVRRRPAPRGTRARSCDILDKLDI